MVGIFKNFLVPRNHKIIFVKKILTHKIFNKFIHIFDSLKSDRRVDVHESNDKIFKNILECGFCLSM